MQKQYCQRMLAAFLAGIMMFSCCPALAQSVDITPAALVTQSAPVNGMVRVYLSSLGNPSTLNLTTQGSYLINGETGRSISSGSSLTVSFQSSTGNLTLSYGGNSYQMGNYFILRRTGTDSANGVKIKQSKESGNPYPGDVSFRAVKQSGGGYKLYTVVHVYIEDYLYGVLPYEMGNSSSLEALKAQAVAARTYTVRMMESRSSGYYDVVDTTSDQVYRGTPPGNANCVAAVDQTRGIVLKYNGAYAVTYYSASNGGQTESLLNVKGSTAYPYLVVKDDPFDFGNPSSLVKSKTVYSDLQSGNNSSTFITKLKSKTVTALKQKGYNATAANTTLLLLKNVAPHTPKYASPSRLYTKMDFTLTARTGTGVTAAVTVTFDIFSELESMFSMNIQSSQNELWSARRNSSGTGFVLEARRYGHGYGLSQRGAMYMGKQGYTYDQILGFYYEGCTRVKQSFINKVINPESGLEDTEVQQPADAPDNESGKCTASVQLVSNLSNLPIRNEKSNDGDILILLGNGALVEVLSSDGGWCLVRYGKIVGYVPASSLRINGTPSGEAEQITQIQGFVTVNCSDYVNLRSGPSLSASRITTAPTGSVLTVFSVSGSWAYVQYGSTSAYVNTGYVTAVSGSYPQNVTISPGNTAVVFTESGTGTVNLRATASTSGQVLKQIPVGEKVTILSDDGAWARLRYDELEGYMMSQFLKYVKEGEETEDSEEKPTTPPETTLPEETPAPAGHMYVLHDNTSLYERAQTESPLLATLQKGQQVEMLVPGDHWSYVQYGQLTGYVLSENLSAGKPADDPEDAPSNPPAGNEAKHATVSTESGSLNLRAEPSLGSRVLTTIPRNARVTVTAYGDEWCGVSYGGVSGYAMSRFLSFGNPDDSAPAPTPDGNGDTATVLTPGGSLNLREEPVSGSRILRTIPRLATVQVNSYGPYWCHVTYAGVSGYVMTNFLSFSMTPDQEETPAPPESLPAAGTAQVTTLSGSLNLRQNPSYQAAVIYCIPQYAMVDVLEKGSGWSRVRYNGLEGYVVSSYLTFGEVKPEKPENTVQPETTEKPSEFSIAWVYTPSGSLNLREQPVTGAKVLTQIPRGTEVTVLEKGSGWCHILYGNLEGYVMTDFLSFTVAPVMTEENQGETTAPKETSSAEESQPSETDIPKPAPVPESTDSPQPEIPDAVSTEMEVLSPRKNAVIVPESGEECPLYSDLNEESGILIRLPENTPVILWMQGEEWCLVQYDIEDETKLAYIRTHHLQMTGE